MKLATLFLKTERHQKLFKLLWVQELRASVREYSLMSGLPYATTYELLQKLEKMGVVEKTVQGRANLLVVKSSPPEVDLLKKLVNVGDEKKRFADYEEMDLPLVGNFEDLNNESAQSKEELLVKSVVLAKRKSSLLRTLPLLVVRLGVDLNVYQLMHWARQFHAERELGFVLELASQLSREKKFAGLARKFHDRRWSKEVAFLENEASLKGFQAKLVEKNTPKLAKKWHLKMNMGLDSFVSHYNKFVNVT